MKLFQDLNRYVTQNATVSLAGNNPVNVAECSNTIFQGLLALHVLRQEPESHHVIREYAENTLQIANSTGLYEFLHVMHTEVLREHARDEKSYFTKSSLTNIKRLSKSKFGNMHDIDDMGGMDGMGSYGVYNNQDVQTSAALSNLFLVVLMIAGIIIGFFAVPHLCNDNTERGKNVKLGLYVLLILTGGQVGWFLALLWLFKINICL